MADHNIAVQQTLVASQVLEVAYQALVLACVVVELESLAVPGMALVVLDKEVVPLVAVVALVVEVQILGVPQVQEKACHVQAVVEDIEVQMAAEMVVGVLAATLHVVLEDLEVQDALVAQSLENLDEEAVHSVVVYLYGSEIYHSDVCHHHTLVEGDHLCHTLVDHLYHILGDQILEVYRICHHHMEVCHMVDHHKEDHRMVGLGHLS